MKARATAVAAAQCLHRGTRHRGTRVSRAESDVSDGDDSDDSHSLASCLDKVMQLLKDKRYNTAARIAMRSLHDHPSSTELMHLLAEAQAGIKWYPHFLDALVWVTLTGPSPTCTIGDVLTVKYDYSHQRPEHETKSFQPFSSMCGSLVKRHDAKLMRNSHLPDEKVERVLSKVGGVEALQRMRTESNHSEWLACTLPKLPAQITSKIPVPKKDVGHGWPENEVMVVRECLEEMEREESLHLGRHAGAFKALVHAKTVKEAIQYRLKEELSVERSLDDIDKVMRLVRLYEQLKQLDAVTFRSSGEEHEAGDCIALVQMPYQSLVHIPHADQSNAFFHNPSSPERHGKQNASSSHPPLTEDDSDDNSSGDDLDFHERHLDVQEEEEVIKWCLVPPGNTGEIDFSACSLQQNTRYQFRYYMKGSSTAACVSAAFTSTIPVARVEVPREAVLCGEPWSCSYSILLTRPHNDGDWLGVYQEEEEAVGREQDESGGWWGGHALGGGGTDPLPALTHRLPLENEGRVDLANSPSFPGTYRVKYHLGQRSGQHLNAVAAVSGPLTVRIRTLRDTSRGGGEGVEEWRQAPPPPEVLEECQERRQQGGSGAEDSRGSRGSAAQEWWLAGGVGGGHALREGRQREVRVLVCSTVADVVDERAALLQRVVPALQRACESRCITVTVVPMSLGLRPSMEAAGQVSEEETATVQHLHVMLQEIDRCRPYFVGIIAERYGWIADSLPEVIKKAYPWLSVARNQHLLLPGIRASALEIGILNGFLVDPALATHNLFLLRNAAHAARMGVSADKRKHFVPSSECSREAVNLLRDVVANVPSANCVRYKDTESMVTVATLRLLAAIEHDFGRPLRFPLWRRINLTTHSYYSHLLAHQRRHHPNALAHTVGEYADIIFGSGGAAGSPGQRSSTRTSTSTDAGDDVHESQDVRPCYLRGQPATGKSTLIASALHHHLTRLTYDAAHTTRWLYPDGGGVGDALRDKGGAQVGCMYQQAGILHLVLVQHVGSEGQLATLADVLEHAMTFTTALLGLEAWGEEAVPWDAGQLLKCFSRWLRLVCQRAVFVWVIDGIDDLVGEACVDSRTWATPDASGGGGGGGGVQGVQPAHGQSSPVVTNTSSIGGRGAISTSKAPSKLASPDRNALNKASSLLLSPDRHALNKPDRNALNKPPPGFDEAAGGASTTHLGGQGGSASSGAGSAVARLIASRKSASQTLSQCFLPLLDKSSGEYAPTAYPNLRLTLVGGGAPAGDADGNSNEGYSNDPHRPIHPALANVLARNEGVRVLEMPVWTSEQRAAFVKSAMLCAGVGEQVIATSMRHVAAMTRITRNEHQEDANSSSAYGGTAEWQAPDPFGNIMYTTCFTSELIRICLQHQAAMAQERDSASHHPLPSPTPSRLSQEGGGGGGGEGDARGSADPRVASPPHASQSHASRPSHTPSQPGTRTRQNTAAAAEGEAEREDTSIDTFNEQVKAFFNTPHLMQDLVLKEMMCVLASGGSRVRAEERLLIGEHTLVSGSSMQLEDRKKGVTLSGGGGGGNATYLTSSEESKYGNTNLPHVVLILKYLLLSREGLRENELLSLLLRHQDITGEEFVGGMRVVEAVTWRCCGLVQVVPWAKKVLASCFFGVNSQLLASLPGAESVEDVSMAQCLSDMAALFRDMNNPERQVAELPLLLLRQRSMDELLQLITTQVALRFMRPRKVLAYMRAGDWPAEDVGEMLKRKLEEAFDIETTGGRRYDLSKITAQVTLGPAAHKPGSEMEEEELMELKKTMERNKTKPAQRTVMLLQHRVHLLTSRACDVAGMLCKLGPPSMQLAESLLESLLKMLYTVDSLVQTVEGSTKFAAEALAVIRAFLGLFRQTLLEMYAIMQLGDKDGKPPPANATANATANASANAPPPPLVDKDGKTFSRKKKAMENRALLQLIITKVGIMRQLLNALRLHLHRHKEPDAHASVELREEALGQVESELGDLITSIEAAFLHLNAITQKGEAASPVRKR